MSAKKGKLHELLAVEKGLETAASDALKEATDTFNKRADHFIGSVRTYEPLLEEEREEVPDEHKELVTTVDQKLAFVFKHVTRWLDAVLQKEVTNQQAVANIVIGGAVLATAVPATYLLGLEKKLRQVRAMLGAIPTLSPGNKWERDASKGEGIWAMAHPEERVRTKKVIQHKVLYEATEQHPAQIEKWSEDTPIGKFIKNVWSGMKSPAEKSELLGRLDLLERAVKKARQRANSQEASKDKVGAQLVKFLLEGHTPAAPKPENS